MAQTKRGAPHGLYRAYVQLVGDNGYSYGIAGQTLANGSTSSAYIIDDPVSANVPTPDRTVIDFQGGDRWISSYQYGINSLGNFEFVTQDLDTTLISLCTGSLADQTSNDLWTIYSEDWLREALPQISLTLIYRLQSFESSTFNTTRFLHTFIPRCWMAPKGTSGAPAYQAKGQYNWQVVPTAATCMINGIPFSSNQNFRDNKAPLYGIIADHPLLMTVHKVTGTAASFATGFRPFTNAVGTASSSRNWIAKNGVAGVADSVNATSGVVAVGTGTTVVAGDYLADLYETDLVPI